MGIKKITVINRPCCTTRIVGATIDISIDKDGEHLLWFSKFKGIRKVYTWSVKLAPVPTFTTTAAVTTSTSSFGEGVSVASTSTSFGKPIVRVRHYFRYDAGSMLVRTCA